MVQKKWVVGLSAFLLVALLFVGYMAMAAELGGRDDPLVTVSYITDELIPGLSGKIDAAVAAKTQEYSDQLEAKYNQLVAGLESGVAGGLTDPELIDAVAEAVLRQQGAGAGTGGAVPSADTMKRVDITNGQTLKLALGSEALLRLGSAVCVASGSPGLIDATTGGELANGGALEKNHIYLATVEGRGFKADGAVTVFVRGSYTLA
ncbi:MAG: hypothetical protein LBH86_10175 [Oscillospiraceae bacterium]|jgi:hypothetical protein|nr:hypothetical protein [Oscillospiraceae bacterium]